MVIQFRPTHKPTVYPCSNQAQCSLSVTPDIGTWRQLNIFIDVLCPAVHSWMLTADLLWCWRLTRPPLCRICAGVDRIVATYINGKRVGSLGSSGILKPHSKDPPNPPILPNQPNPLDLGSKSGISFSTSPIVPTSNCGSGMLLTISGWKCQFVISFSCNLYNICVKSSDQIKWQELWKCL